MPIDAFVTWRRCAVLPVVLLIALGVVGCRLFLNLQAGSNNSADDPAKYGDKNGETTYKMDCFCHISWFVQISDLHFSVFHGKYRMSDLKSFCQNTLPVVAPEVVLVTGDITDAKTEDREGSRQYEDEWKQYDRVLRETGVLEHTVWLDTRGNHDSFSVPSLTSHENYFSVYSARGKHGLLSYNYQHKTKHGDVISFISVDACPNPGPKRPFNFFGILPEAELNRLEQFAEASRNANQTVFFGHYPTSTIGGAVKEIRKILGHGSLYLCGHLHTLGGLFPHMYARQKTGYLELELADWRDQRIYRVVAVDHGLVSFIDVAFDSWPVVLITNPKNAQFLVPGHEPVHRIYQSNNIRILVFSPSDVVTATVRINGVYLGEAEHVKGPLYILPWQPFRYAKGEHVINVHVVTESGEETTVVQPFVINGTQPGFDILERFLLMSDHSVSAKIVFVFFFLAKVLPLIVIKLVRVHFHLPVESRLTSCLIRLAQCWMRRLCLICSTPSIFYPLMFYDFYIALGPWFIGEVIAGHVGVCFIFGFFVNGTFIPTVLTYVYGALQLLIFSTPLTLYIGRCLDLTTIRYHRDCGEKCIPGRLAPLIWLLDHGFFFVLVGFQLYLAISGFYRSYGGLALMFCPLRTWAIVLAIYLRRQALRDNSHIRQIQVELAAVAETANKCSDNVD